MQVIKRGKALEYFSRHYSQVFAEEGRDFTVKEALLGINQLLDDEQSGDSGISPPASAEPLSRQFLRIFMDKTVPVRMLAAQLDRRRLENVEDGTFKLLDERGTGALHFTTARDVSLEREDLELIGLDHPLVERYLQQYQRNANSCTALW